MLYCVDINNVAKRNSSRVAPPLMEYIQEVSSRLVHFSFPHSGIICHIYIILRQSVSLISHRWLHYPMIKFKRNPALKSFSNERNLHFITMNLPQLSWANNPRSQHSTSPIQIWLPHRSWSLKVIYVSIFILRHVLHLKYKYICNPHCPILSFSQRRLHSLGSLYWGNGHGLQPSYTPSWDHERAEGGLVWGIHSKAFIGYAPEPGRSFKGI